MRRLSGGAQPPTRHAPLLCAMLLLYMEPPDAFACLCSLLHAHFLGQLSGGEQAQWRLKCAGQVVARELPELAQHLSALGVEPRAFLPQWLGTLFMTTLALDTAARVWDCYLRDGELFVWRCALEILRLLQPQLLRLTEREACLALLCGATSLGERELFHSISAHEAGITEWLGELQQKLPLPTVLNQGSVAYDLYTNSYLCQRAPSPDGEVGQLSTADEEGDDPQPLRKQPAPQPPHPHPPPLQRSSTSSLAAAAAVAAGGAAGAAEGTPQKVEAEGGGAGGGGKGSGGKKRSPLAGEGGGGRSDDSACIVS